MSVQLKHKVFSPKKTCIDGRLIISASTLNIT